MTRLPFPTGVGRLTGVKLKDGPHTGTRLTAATPIYGAQSGTYESGLIGRCSIWLGCVLLRRI